MSKKKAFNIIELALQGLAFLLLFIDGAFICSKNCGQTYSLINYYSTAWKIIVLILFAVNSILCLNSIIKNSTRKDSVWHISISIINVLAFLPFAYNVEHDCTPTKWDVIAFNAGTPFYLLLLVLVVIVFVSFIKRSNSIISKEEVQDKINNIQETSNADELKKYKNLLDNGVITQEEFNEKKKQLLGL